MAIVTSEAFCPSKSSTICWRRLAGTCGSTSALRSSSEPSRTAGEPEQLVDGLVEAALGPRHQEQGVGVVGDSLLDAHSFSGVGSGAGGARTDLVDVVLDQPNLRVAIEVPLHDHLGRADGQSCDLVREVGDGLLLGDLDLVL